MDETLACGEENNLVLNTDKTRGITVTVTAEDHSNRREDNWNIAPPHGHSDRPPLRGQTAAIPRDSHHPGHSLYD